MAGEPGGKDSVEQRPLMAAMSEVFGLLQVFLADRSLEDPDGRPLYGYRCKDAEFDALERALQAELEVDPTSVARPGACRTFCLWGAEWWRRNHFGGPWTWEPLLRRLNAHALSPGAPGYSDLTSAVRKGLRWWGREIITTEYRRAFLITLACEGGLPLRMVRREATHLRRFFRALFEEIQAFGETSVPPSELAARVGFILPKTLRQAVVFRLSGDLASEIWRLKELVDDPERPVRDLNLKSPGWRDRLPVALDDDIARALLNGLLSEASAVSAGHGARVEWTRSLTRAGDTFELHGELKLPSTLEAEHIRQLWNMDPASRLPARFGVRRADRPDRAQLVAIAYPAALAAEAAYRVELANRRSSLARGTDAARPQEIRLEGRDDEYTTTEFPGAPGLSELPWVFDVGEEEHDAEAYPLLADGSADTTSKSVLIAIRPGDSLDTMDGTVCERRGRLHDCERDVYSLRGTATVADGEGSFVRIRSGTQRRHVARSYVLSGSVLRARGKAIAFLGPPSVFRLDANARRRRVSAEQVLWSPLEVQRPWTELSGIAVGDGRLRVVSGSVIHHSTRATLLPSGTQIEILADEAPGRGVLRLVGSEADSVRAVPSLDSTFECKCDSGAWSVYCTAPGGVPSAVTLELIWDGRGRARLQLPFPSAGFGFYEPDGSALPDHTRIPLGRLSGCRAQALLPRTGIEVFLESDYRGNDSQALSRSQKLVRRPLEETAPGLCELDLGRMSLAVREQLDGSPDPAAWVRLAAHTNAAVKFPRRQLEVSRFDLRLVLDVDTGTVGLGEVESDARSVGTELRVEWHTYGPGAVDPVTLRQISPALWALPEPTAELPGLLVLFDGDWCRAVPPDWPQAASVDAGVLLSDPDGDEWQVLWHLLEVATSVAALAVGPLRDAFLPDPDLLCTAALVATDSDFDRLYRAAEASRFFLWHLLPLGTWRTGLDRIVDARLTSLDPTAAAAHGLDLQALVREQLERRCERLGARLSGHSSFLRLALSRRFSSESAPALAKLHTDEMQKLLRSQYTEDLLGCPAFRVGSGELDMGGLRPLVQSVRGHEVGRVFYGDKGRLENERVQLFANAPLMTAVAAFAPVPVNDAQTAILSAVRSMDPNWFDRTYSTAVHLLMGVERGRRIAAQLDEFDA